MLLTCRVRLGTGSGWEKETIPGPRQLSSNRRMSPESSEAPQLTVNHGSSDQMAPDPRKEAASVCGCLSLKWRPTLPLDASQSDDDIDIAVLGRPHLLGPCP